MSDVTIRRALLSVSDKTGVVELASRLHKGGVELVSTGGTARALRDAGLPVRDVADVTGFPEMMDGRVKTLHPLIHGGLLAVRDDADHAASMEAHDIGAIDLLVCNLYPFEETVARGADRAEVIENIDIGGPAMIRSASKNHGYVTIVTDPADYATLLEELAGNDGATTEAFRIRMAGKAFARTASYDAAIANWFAWSDAFSHPAGPEALDASLFPPVMPLAFRRDAVLRYGENPHQQAAIYKAQAGGAGVPQAQQVQGKELSYNNFNDADAALELVAEFAGQDPAVVILKHANPCGVAQAATPLAAWREALACDSVSAFGGIVALNTPLDGATAAAIAEIFTEVVIAPGADEEAREIFAAKKNLRLLLTENLPDPRRPGLMLKSIAGGLLVQSRDNGAVTADMLQVVTKRAPTERELADCLFAWTIARHVKSNAIVFAKDGVTAGIGAGQMNRRDSARIAAIRAREAAETEGWAEPRTIGSAMASEAFLPFADGLQAAIDAGATAVIQPGGAMRDDEVIAAADEAGLAMVFTGMRHFRH
ncbi:bifunctional phosphoribosylaminoimidazolecarboxamide formyltransferase/IMP cyclohydrolase [Altererythrobacter xixiisoli]|uniref:Bifunctional purine biosynthesis protein PurH n=1 Tax=Croceibacterium xixiisoli TaxID=1476466 RepID=A0A6I4TSB6_9SPHN|nr:bifunctional phosphoribosylaminoimidazolecarboxamide formyltransferase/IMP cyclohydrolase [Croceibacterium xixiisoli]MXO97488.1 bifunctional phosphoribosylaminoimidazolecarboxamide formyltransferase/IMP cyclohydrolase [Croceibacterium xixiisoli]